MCISRPGMYSPPRCAGDGPVQPAPARTFAVRHIPCTSAALAPSKIGLCSPALGAAFCSLSHTSVLLSRQFAPPAMGSTHRSPHAAVPALPLSCASPCSSFSSASAAKSVFSGIRRTYCWRSTAALSTASQPLSSRGTTTISAAPESATAGRTNSSKNSRAAASPPRGSTTHADTGSRGDERRG